jgi:hypothetical protein
VCDFDPKRIGARDTVAIFVSSDRVILGRRLDVSHADAVAESVRVAGAGAVMALPDPPRRGWTVVTCHHLAWHAVTALVYLTVAVVVLVVRAIFVLVRQLLAHARAEQSVRAADLRAG